VPAATVRLEPGLRLRGRRQALLRITTTGPDDRQVTVRIRTPGRRGALLGAGSVRSVSGRAQTVRVALTLRGRALLRTRRAAKVTVELRLDGRVLRTTLRVVHGRR
jgi:hypothetical protein